MSLRLLANENVPLAVVGALRARGHDVSSVGEDAPGSTDPAILRQATDEARLLLTFDKDFGELAVRARLPAASGIVLLRMPPLPPSVLSETVAEALESRDDWTGHLAVVEPGRIRMSRLPAAPPGGA